jgi:stress-induced morphogen
MERPQMAAKKLKNRIRSVLKSGYFSDPDDLVDISDGPDGNIHVVVVSRKFDGRPMKEKHDLIWSELSGKLSADEWGKITLSIGMSPEEIKSL